MPSPFPENVTSVRASSSRYAGLAPKQHSAKAEPCFFDSLHHAVIPFTSIAGTPGTIFGTPMIFI